MLIRCERCSTTFVLDAALLAPEGSAVQCTRCEAVFTAFPPGTEEERYRSAQGRIVFGSPQVAPNPQLPRRHAMFFGAPFSTALPGPREEVPLPPPPPRRVHEPGVWPAPVAPPTNELDVLWLRAIEDEQAQRVASDALMEREDLRGKLIAMQLDEQRSPELLRRVKINVIIRDHAASWSPRGARITRFEHGAPAAIDWTGQTDPLHVAWRMTRRIHCTLQQVPTASVFDHERPRLEHVSGLSRNLTSHVLDARPPGLKWLEGRLHRDELVADLGMGRGLRHRLAPFTRLEGVTLLSTEHHVDPQLTGEHVREAFSVFQGLKLARLSLPLLPLAELDRCCAVAPRVTPQFISFMQGWNGELLRLVLDLRTRTVHARHHPPSTTLVEQRVQALSGELGGVLQLQWHRSPEATRV